MEQDRTSRKSPIIHFQFIFDKGSRIYSEEGTVVLITTTSKIGKDMEKKKCGFSQAIIMDHHKKWINEKP